MRSWVDAQLDDPKVARAAFEEAFKEYTAAASRADAMAVWLDKITGAAFFGATAPDDSTMQFTITVTAAEWREMRALVGADSKPSPEPVRPSK